MNAKLPHSITLPSATLLLLLTFVISESSPAAERPNILVILADDLGYGDVQCYNPERGKIATPHIDKLAAQGMRFTDGNTMVILSSDNGPASYVGTGVSEDPKASQEDGQPIKNLEAKGHFPAGPLRGYKASVHEGGHRVPFIIRWPEVVKPGGVCGQLVHQADLIRTFADVVGATLPDNAGEDSFSLLPLLRGEDKPIREHAICATGTPSLRQGPWKLIMGADAESKAKDRPPVQLYNLDDDLGETKNVDAASPEKVGEMKALLEKLITDDRSTPGALQKNDVEVVRYPLPEAAKRKAKK